MNLAKTGWPEVLSQVATMGYFKYVQQNSPMNENISSQMKLDVLIPVIEKDMQVLPAVIDGVCRNLRHPIGTIFVVGPDSPEIKTVCSHKKCTFVNEDSVLPITRAHIEYTVSGIDRSGWLFQQLIKWAGDTICAQQNYLVIDADTVLVRPQVFEVDGRIVLLHSDEHHPPYFDLYRRLFGKYTKTHLSFVAHQMVFSRDYIRQIKSEIENSFGTCWLDAIASNIDGAESSGMSEYELYGQWMLENHPDKIIRQYWRNVSLGRSMLAELDTITPGLAKNYRSVSFHQYERPVSSQALRGQARKNPVAILQEAR